MVIGFASLERKMIKYLQQKRYVHLPFKGGGTFSTQTQTTPSNTKLEY